MALLWPSPGGALRGWRAVRQPQAVDHGQKGHGLPAWDAEPHPTAQISYPAAPTRWLGSAIFSFGGRGGGQFTDTDYVPRLWGGGREGRPHPPGGDWFFFVDWQSIDIVGCPV